MQCVRYCVLTVRIAATKRSARAAAARRLATTLPEESLVIIRITLSIRHNIKQVKQQPEMYKSFNHLQIGSTL